MKNIYRHPLDYALGLKHYLTDKRISVRYSPNPHNFHVTEIIDLKRLGYDMGLDGEYLVYRIVKRGVDTWRVLREFSQMIRVPEQNIVFLGLKDRGSTSVQHFFVKKSIVRDVSWEYFTSIWKATLTGSVKRKPSRNDLVGNRFEIIVENADRDVFKTISEVIGVIRRRGLPSYYGYQRFGVKRFNTHLLGKYLLAGRVDLFMDELLYRLYPGEPVDLTIRRIMGVFDRRLYYEYKLINNIQKHGFRGLRKLLTSMLKGLFIDAYQSYLYNLMISNMIDMYGWSALDKEYPMPSCSGSEDYYMDICRSEGVDPSIFEDLDRCWYRRGLFYPREVSIEGVDDKVIIRFMLEKGYYATILLRELFKENLHI